MENSSTYNTLISKLDEFIRKYYKNQLIRGVLYTTAILLSGYLTISLLEYYAHFDTTVRTVLFWSFLAAAGYVVGKFIVLPLTKINRIGKIISHEQAANIIGQHFTNVQDKLLNVLQLQKSGSGTGASDALVEASINQRIKELRPVPFTSAIDLKQNRRYVKWALIPLLVIVVIVFTNANLLTESANRLVNHSDYFEEQAPFSFNIQNPLEAVENEDFTLALKMTGAEIPANVTLLVDGNEYVMNRENTIDFNYVFRNVQGEKTFRFFADGFTSKEYTLKVLPNPIVLNFDAELKYPAYTGKKNETVRNTGDLVVPAGTVINWNFSTRSTNSFVMKFIDSTFKLNQVGDDRFAFTKKVLESERYSLHTANQFLKGKDSIDYTISVVPDLYPAISVEERKDSISKLRLYFTGEVKDDYGFSRLQFTFRPLNKKDSLGNDIAPQTQFVNLPVRSNLVRDQFYYYWDLASLGIETGDEIEYYFEVWDNDAVHGAKSTRSQRMIYKAPTAKDLANMNDSANAQIEKELEAALEESKLLQEDIDKLHQQIVEKKNVGWEERQKLDALKQKQSALQQRIDMLKQKNAQNQQQQQEFNQNDPPRQEDMDELFKNLSTKEMEQMIKKLEELAKDPNKDKTQKTLEEAKKDQENTEKDLDRTLEQFREMQFRQKLDDAIQKLDTLQKQQQELSNQSEQKNLSKQQKEDIANKQDSLNKQFNELRNQLDKVDSMNQKLENPHEIPNTDLQEMQIQKEQRNASQEMNSKDGDAKKGSESQQNAADQMKQLSEDLKKAEEDMDSQENAEDVQTIRTLLDNLLQLSFDQEALKDKVKKTGTSDPQYPALAREQNRLRDNSRMIEDSLLALTKRNPMISPLVNKEITNINYQMDQSIRKLSERETGEAQNAEQRAMTSINTLALMLNESLENMMMQMNPKNQGEPKNCKGGKCKKPGNGKPNKAGNGQKPGKQGNKPGMSGIRQRQEKLNQQMRNAQQKGQNGQGGASAEELAKMAAEQEQIRRLMQEALKDTENDGGGTPGGATAEKMEETETDLVNKNVTAETLQRQQEILDKMLEFEKAEQQREQDEQRQANEAKNYELSNPNGFSEYNRQKQQEAELLRTVPPALVPYYKNKVNMYFSGVE
jgi:hypothetical protein